MKGEAMDWVGVEAGDELLPRGEAIVLAAFENLR